MRKKTAPRTRKQNKASSSETSGLIAKGTNRSQSAGAKPALDSHSHRTPPERGGSLAPCPDQTHIPGV